MSRTDERHLTLLPTIARAPALPKEVLKERRDVMENMVACGMLSSWVRDIAEARARRLPTEFGIEAWTRYVWALQRSIEPEVYVRERNLAVGDLLTIRR